MSRINLGVVFGGMSTENEVSVVSGTSVVRNLNKEKYNIYPIYISKNLIPFDALNNIQSPSLHIFFIKLYILSPLSK